MGKYVKRLPSSKAARALGRMHECVLRHFSVSPRMYAPILPTNYKRLQSVFNVVAKQRQNRDRTHYAIFQNRHIYVSCQLYGLVHYAACVFLSIYKWLAFCACGCGCSGCLYGLGLYGRLESDSVSVFDGLVYL